MSEKVLKDSMDGMPERELLIKSQKAAKEFASYTPAQVDKIVEAVAAAAFEKAQDYAEWAVRETGFGVVEHKVLKNQAASAALVEYYRGQCFAGYEVDPKLKVVKFARPAGVVLGVTPCTNPISTIFYKVLVSLMGRNSIVFCPHPASKDCCADAADVLLAAAVKAGAPENVVQVVREPSIPVVDAMMKSDLVNVILATGGPGLVKAAYSSGGPAVGVGPGNVAHYVDETADISKAAADVVFSASFDNNVLCTGESVVLAKNAIADQLLASMTEQGAYLLPSADDVAKLRGYLFPEGKMNPESIGQSAQFIADKAGIVVPEGTVLLCVTLKKIDENDEFSCEKMFPIVGVLRVEDTDEALTAAQEMIRFGGSGHSAAIHSTDNDAILAWGSLNVCRVTVNGPAALVSAGLGAELTAGLNPTMTLGTGYFGGASIGDNIGPMHLIEWTQLAYDGGFPADDDAAVEAALKHWDASRG